eukprot:15651770-Heterocapsa_arctica.AAC.1
MDPRKQLMRRRGSPHRQRMIRTIGQMKAGKADTCTEALRYDPFHGKETERRGYALERMRI